MGQLHDPIALFISSLERARAGETDATAVALASSDLDGRPSVRMVLLKHVDAAGFVFYTNFESRKATELDSNPNAALCFYWPSIGEQIRVEGTVERVPEAESDAYFASRGRGSRLGAWASRQSRPLETRFALLRRYAELQARYIGKSIPRPGFWGGYRLSPRRVEVWSTRPHRLHERIVYTKEHDEWKLQRLYP